MTERSIRLRQPTGLAHPDELEPGDRVWVECEVFDDPKAYPPGAHVHVRPVNWRDGGGGLWQAGDQYIWTWRTRQRSHPDAWIRRAERRTGKGQA